MELWSPLVEEKLPEPPIKDIEDTVPLPYDKLLSVVKSLGKSPSKPEVIGKLREPETFTGKDPNSWSHFYSSASCISGTYLRLSGKTAPKSISLYPILGM